MLSGSRDEDCTDQALCQQEEEEVDFYFFPPISRSTNVTTSLPELREAKWMCKGR